MAHTAPTRREIRPKIKNIKKLKKKKKIKNTKKKKKTKKKKEKKKKKKSNNPLIENPAGRGQTRNRAKASGPNVPAVVWRGGAGFRVVRGGGLFCVVRGGGPRSVGAIIAAALDARLEYRAGADVGPALGAARLARMAVTREAAETAAPAGELHHAIDPDPALRERLAPRLAAFRALYPAVRAAHPHPELRP
jgi:hypothetical protein